MNGPVDVTPERMAPPSWGCDMPKQLPKVPEACYRQPKETPPTGWEPKDLKEAVPPSLQEDRGRDDGTAVWGNPQRQSKVSRWKEEQQMLQNAKLQQQQQQLTSATSANGIIGGPSHSSSSPGMIRIPPASAPLISSPTVKPADAWMKSQPQAMNSGRNPWAEGPAAPAAPQFSNHRSDSSGWGQPDPADAKRPVAAWGESDPNSSPPGAQWAKPKSSNSWSDGQIDTSSWGGPKQKPLTKEMIIASKQFRVLTEMGYKRDDVENTLRTANMNIEEALSMSCPLLFDF